MEINDKDLEQATGGIQFIGPGGTEAPDYSSSKMKVDLNHCCEHFDRAMYSTGAQSGCVNCEYLLKDRDNNYFCRGYHFDHDLGAFTWEY